MSQRTRPILAGIAAAAGCLGDFVLWWIVVPCAIAFMVAAYYLSPVLFFGSIIVTVVAVGVVLLTTTVGYLRAKRAVIERQIRDEEDPSAESP